MTGDGEVFAPDMHDKQSERSSEEPTAVHEDISFQHTDDAHTGKFCKLGLIKCRKGVLLMIYVAHCGCSRVLELWNTQYL